MEPRRKGNREERIEGGEFMIQEYSFEFFLKDMNKSENKGLISVDRNNKVTLRLTIPCSMFKSSAKDLSLEIFGFTMWANTRLEHNGMIQAAHRRR